MYKKILLKIKNYLANFIQIQLILTIISLPILVSWGLAISKASIIGNLIFAPFLTIFLILSSLIFFSELIHIPNSFLINLLNHLTIFWNYCLNCGSKTWLIGFCKPNLFVLLAIPIITFFTLKLKIINTIIRRLLVLCSILFLSICYFSYPHCIKQTAQETLIENKFQITKDDNGNINITDLGLFSRKKSIENFLEYELKPHMLQTFGTLNINNLTINKPNVSNFKAGIEFCKIFNLKQLTLPIFNKKLNKYEWKLFFDLKRILQENNVKFVRT